MSKTVIDIDTRTFIRFWLVLLGIGLAIAFIYQSLTGLIIIGISIFLALALKPLVRKFNNFLGNKTTAAVLAYSIIVIFLILIVLIIGPVVVNETSKFVQQIPTAFETSIGGWNGINRFGQNLGIENLQGEISKALTSLSNNIINNLGTTVTTSISAISDTIVKAMLVLVLTLLFSVEGPKIMDRIWHYLGTRKEDKKSVDVARRVVSRMGGVVSSYVAHQVLVAFIDGCATMFFTFIITLAFGLSPTLAIPMGLISFIFYLIPMFGQFIGSCIVTVVLAFSNPIAAIVFVVAYVIYIQIENNLIAPKIQGNAMRLPAVVVLCATIIGMYSFGLLGAIIAIPIAGCIRVLIEEYPNIKSIRD